MWHCKQLPLDTTRTDLTRFLAHLNALSEDYFATDEVDCIRIGRDIVANLNWRKLGPAPTSDPDAPLFDPDELLGVASIDLRVPFDPREVIGLLPHATVMMGVPTFYTRLLAEPGLDRNACRHIRLFVSGSAPLLAETFAEQGYSVIGFDIDREKIKRLRLKQSYGNVESSPPKIISVSGIVREVLKGIAPMASENGVELKSDICADPCKLLGDSLQINRAIQNVVVNAVQASIEKKGTVTVSCAQRDFYVDLRVEDTGAGIHPAQLNRIFDPYFTTKQAKSGTGLGLYITKKVVEDHNGSIKAESTPGVGTIFTIRLPLSTN